jgi:hypothetical protein
MHLFTSLVFGAAIWSSIAVTHALKESLTVQRVVVNGVWTAALWALFYYLAR